MSTPRGKPKSGQVTIIASATKTVKITKILLRSPATAIKIAIDTIESKESSTIGIPKSSH